MWVERYRCAGCGHPFRHYPEGVSRATQTAQLVVGTPAWPRGAAWGPRLSTWATSQMLGGFGVPPSHLSVWRDASALAGTLRRQLVGRAVPVLGVDGTGSRLAGQLVGLVVAVDLGEGLPVALAVLDEHDTAALTAWRAQVRGGTGSQWG